MTGQDSLTIGSLCTGYGGLDLGVIAALGGGRIAWVADHDRHVRHIITARMPGIPNLGDITEIDWRHVEPVDVITAGFPCQDISAAGPRTGIRKGTRSGLWQHVVTAVRHLRPVLLVVENVAALRWRNGDLGAVLADLATIGYDAQWTSLRASDLGAPHRRERVFVLAYPARTRVSIAADTTGPRLEITRRPGDRSARSGCATAPHATSRRRRENRPQPGETPSHRPPDQPDRYRHHTPADSDRQQPQRWRTPCPLAGTSQSPPSPPDQRQRHGHPTLDRSAASADPTSHRRHQRQPEPTRLGRRPHPVLDRGTIQPDKTAGNLVPATSGLTTVDWGEYEPAIRRWEAVLGRPAPRPTEPSPRTGRPRLSAAFVEWLMGLQPGWVADLDIPRTAQLRALGNGVIPQQATHAIQLMLADLTALDAEHEQEHAA